MIKKVDKNGDGKIREGQFFTEGYFETQIFPIFVSFLWIAPKLQWVPCDARSHSSPYYGLNSVEFVFVHSVLSTLFALWNKSQEMSVWGIFSSIIVDTSSQAHQCFRLTKTISIRIDSLILYLFNDVKEISYLHFNFWAVNETGGGSTILRWLLVATWSVIGCSCLAWCVWRCCHVTVWSPHSTLQMWAWRSADDTPGVVLHPVLGLSRQSGAFWNKESDLTLTF